MNKRQARFLKDVFKAVTKVQDTDEIVIVLPPNEQIPEAKFAVDAVYVTRLQKERLEK